MSREAVVEFLGAGGTGVVAFAKDDESYAIPVSYGFDPDEERFYLRLAFAPESEKRAFVDATDTVSLVVDEETPEGWKSVVARGRLRGVTEAALDSTVVEAVRAMDIPFVTIYDRPTAELEFELYRLVPDELTGRREKPSRGIE